MMKKILLSCFFLVLIFYALTRGGAQNARAPVIIRDTEIEDTLKEWFNPLLAVSGMGPNSVNIVLVQSETVNAFVAGGANMFLYSGLIEKTENPGELIGVMAHELGHIAAGHLIQARDAMERASYESILGMALGIGAAVATGNGAAANAIILGAGNVAQRRYLAHSRVHESSADQAAFRIMEQADINPSGLVSFLEKLGAQDLVPESRQSEYVRTHPLTGRRIESLEALLRDSPLKDKPYPDLWHEQHARMKAKFIGYTKPEYVAWTYNDSDRSIAAEYARTVAAWRQNNMPDALARLDGLIAQEADNPYFNELKGQILVDAGRVNEALPFFEKTVRLLPGAGLIRIAYAHALLESASDDSARATQAVENLDRALIDEPRSAFAHRLMATAYGRLGRDGYVKLHLAEEALLKRNLPYAKNQARAALETFEPDTREWLQAKDIIQHVENLES